MNKTQSDCLTNEFKVYDLVWAKVTGYPWWPALISEIKNNSDYSVFFLAEKKYCYLPENKIKIYEKFTFADLKIKQNKKATSRLYKLAIQQAKDIKSGKIIKEKFMNNLKETSVGIRESKVSTYEEEPTKANEELQENFADPEEIINPNQIDYEPKNYFLNKKTKSSHTDEFSEKEDIFSEDLNKSILSLKAAEIHKKNDENIDLLEENANNSENSSIVNEQLIFKITKFNQIVKSEIDKINNALNAIYSEMKILGKFFKQEKIKIPQEAKAANELLDCCDFLSKLSCDKYTMTNFLSPLSSWLSCERIDNNQIIQEEINYWKTEIIKKEENYKSCQKKREELQMISFRRLYQFYSSVVTEIFKEIKEDNYSETEEVFYDNVLNGKFLISEIRRLHEQREKGEFICKDNLTEILEKTLSNSQVISKDFLKRLSKFLELKAKEKAQFSEKEFKVTISEIFYKIKETFIIVDEII